MAHHLMSRRWRASTVARIGWQLLRIPKSVHRSNGRQPARIRGELHSIERDRQAVTYHYNVSNDFYALWLDQRMVYSCAYFEAADEDLDTGQERKLDYLCRKLRLVPGDRLLDIGCGWALQVVDKPTFRVWQLFLHGSAYFFTSGLLNLYQALFLKPDKGRSGLPLTRKDWCR
jgi:hypothetical protein